MNISDLSIKRPVTTFMVVMIILILGVVSLTNLKLDLYPNVSLPYAIISTQYEGAGPEEVESIVTANLERVLTTVSDLQSMNSISSEGNSLIMLEFSSGTDLDIALLEVREKIDLIRGMLPDEISDPMVIKLNPNMLPIMNLSISQQDKQASELLQWAEEVVKPRLERLEGVGSVTVSGGREKEIRVTVDPDKLYAYGLTINQITSALMMENINAPGGTAREGQYDLLVRTTGEFASVAEIGEIPIVSQATGAQYRLADIAAVEETEADTEVYSRINGVDSLSLRVRKESIANTVQVAKQIYAALDEIKNQYPDVDMMIVMDQARFINMSVNSVTRNGLMGAVLAVIILILFLRNFRSTLVISVAIPISIIATFVMIYFSRITLNMISLGGLALGVGMMVDNSIVVLENIDRMKGLGMSPEEAASKGAKQVSMAIIASTLTTVSVFLPVVFLQGMTADIFKELALTVTFSLLASLLVALTLVPMLSARWESRHHRGNKEPKAMNAVRRVYGSALGWSLNHRVLTLLLAIVLFGGSVALALHAGTEYFPEVDQGQIDITVDMPNGTRFDESLACVQQVEAIVNGITDVDSVSASVGGGDAIFEGLMGVSQDSGSLTVMLVPLGERSRGVTEIANEIREKAASVAGCEVDVQSTGMMMMGSMGAAISIEIKGNDLDQLGEIAQGLATRIENVPGTAEVASSLESGGPEMRIRLDRQKAASYGINTAMVSQAVQVAFQGTVATRYKVQGREIDVRLRYPAGSMDTAVDVEQLSILSPMGIAVPLSDIAEFIYTEGPASIERLDQSRVVRVDCSLTGERTLGEVSGDIQGIVDTIALPEGYTMHLGGQREEMLSAFGDLGLALALGVVLVYMIMAAQFESLKHPFIIMFTVPLSFAGGMFLLGITGTPLSISAVLGFVMLTGIVVNNGIVLVDYVNQLRRDGMATHEALLEASPTRLRPIMMTMLTTVLALIPLALGIGEGSELMAPMAMTVIGGLLLATLLTLLIVPAVYSLFTPDPDRRRRRRGAGPIRGI
jgi:HAE1 family hydrophobic/amphiphilic exporter-1